MVQTHFGCGSDLPGPREAVAHVEVAVVDRLSQFLEADLVWIYQRSCPEPL
jgi:hypothetical protein